MNCETFQKLVSRALDDALPDDFAQDFHEHREVCVACQEEWRAHSAVRVFLHTLEPGSESCGSLWPVVKSELTARRARDAWFEEMDNFARRLLPVAAVLLLAGILKFWPLPVMTFAFEGQEMQSRFGGGWTGPGLWKAWRLSGTSGAFLRCSLPVLALGAAGAAALVFRARLQRAGWPTFPITLLLWAVVVPYITTVAYAFAAELRERNG